jgi:hypothetical protein
LKVTVCAAAAKLAKPSRAPAAIEIRFMGWQLKPAPS